MAPRLSQASDPGPASTGGGARSALLVASLGLLLLVGVSRPNAAQPDLLPGGWAPGTLLPLGLGPAAVSAVLWVAYLAGAAAVVLGLRRPSRPLSGWRVPLGLGGLTLLAAPFGSADHISYLAYGRILVTGGDPWLEAPAAWAGGLDPVTSRVEAPWTEEPSVYGPVATLVHGLSAWLGGESLRQGVWVWQVLVVLAWLGVRWALRTLVPPAQQGRVDVLWTLNPLVLGVGVLGAHVDVVAAALVVAAVVVAATRPGLAGAAGAGGVLALAASTKVTYGIGLVALGAAWWLLSGRATALRRTTTAVAGFLAVAVPLHVGAGEHVFDQLGRSRQAVSLATPWRLLLDGLGESLGPLPTRGLVTAGAAVLAVVLATLLLRHTRPAPAPTPDAAATPDVAATSDPVTLGVTALWVLAALQLAYSLAAPYSLPWYDALVWAALPAVRPGAVDLLAVARGTLAALAYVPGRVLGMTPLVEEVTLGFRRSVAPWLVLTLWVAVLAVLAGARRVRTGAGRPGWGPRSGPPRAGSRPPPTR